MARAGGSPGRLALGNLLIAAGTLVLSASGTLAGRLGKDRAFVVTLLVGIVVLFAGFLVSPSSKRVRVRHADFVATTPSTGVLATGVLATGSLTVTPAHGG